MDYLLDEEKQLPKPIDPVVSNYLATKYPGQIPASKMSDVEKYNKDFGDEAYKMAQADADERSSGLGWAQFAAGLGDALAGRDPSKSAAAFEGIRRGIKDDTVGAFEKRKAGALTDIKNKKSLESGDPNSGRSIAFRKIIEAKFPDVAKAYGEDWAKVSADDQDSIFRPMQLKEQIEGRKEQARILAGDRAEGRAIRQQEQSNKLEEKMQGLQTPFGLANTVDDAKQLKEAYEAKKNFDNKLNQMIALREKNNGGAVLNREDVARGKQLSKDLLLEYKNMAKLGVLSQSDENIINAIIPEDPLEYNSPLASIQGQDPTLSRLKKFKGDSDIDFSTRVQTRTRDGLARAKSPREMINAPSVDFEPDVLKYAETHGISPEQAKQIKISRTTKTAGF